MSEVKDYLAVGKVPGDEPPFIGRIGFIFHRLVDSLHRRLEKDVSLLELVVSSDETTAVRPLLHVVYHELLPREGFQSLSSEAQEALWNAVEQYLSELAVIIRAGSAIFHKSCLGPAIFLASEHDLSLTREYNGAPLRVTGRIDALIQDPRSAMTVLLDFKLCGLRQDLANLVQVMLYALMLHEEKGIKAGAQLVYLYPVRERISVSWEQIQRFEPALLACVQAAATR